MTEARLLGDYRLIKQIGTGSMGMTYVGEHRFTKKKYVLKVLPEEFASDRPFLQRFEEEVGNISSFEHPHIVKIHNVSFSQGVYFLVADCIVDSLGETINLAQYFSAKGKKLSQPECLSCLQQVAQALDYGHSVTDSSGRKMVHRGLKLNNILISGKAPQIRLHLSDWGLSAIIGIGAALTRTFKGVCESLGIASQAMNARIGQDRYPQPAIDTQKLLPLHYSLIQNFSFLAPEQKRLDPNADEKVDSYAFGILTYYLLTGEYPEGAFHTNFFPNEEPLVDWAKIVTECLQPQSAKRPTHLEALFEQPKAGQKKAVQMLLEIVPPKETNSPNQNPTTPSSAITFVKEERVVKEYAPEKREYQHIQPLLTEMVSIDGGVYFRGNDLGCRDEMPRHRVEIEPFAIDIHPVTNEQFVRFLEYMGGEKDAQHQDIIRLRDSRIKKSAGKLSIEPGYSKHPVVGVTWYGAVAYCNWVGKRLPTEVEWEIACCGGIESALYPTGESIEKTQANFFSADTTAVMSYPPNGYGLYDLAGNVYEWCHDWYEYNYYEGSAQEPNNPRGPLQGVYRVLRGGCWKSLKEDLRTSKRHRNNPGAANGTYGFRCAK